MRLIAGEMHLRFDYFVYACVCVGLLTALSCGVLRGFTCVLCVRVLNVSVCVCARVQMYEYMCTLLPMNICVYVLEYLCLCVCAMH